jgi:hypothetical protein
VTVTVKPPHWTLQGFERDLAVEEIAALTGRGAHWEADTIVVQGVLGTHELRRLQRRLALASEIETSTGARLPTVQHLLEQATGGKRRKITSHALHGLHPYKGKFYPQLARALLNACEVPDDAKVLDPFAGCGTTVLEATILGMRGLGVDANPLAVLVAKTKLAVLAREPEQLRLALKPLSRPPRSGHALPDSPYLERWIPEANLRYLRRVLTAIVDIEDTDAKRLALVCLSSVLRLASYQEPAQLRVLRRPSGAHVPELRGLFEDALADALGAIEAARAVEGVRWSHLARGSAGVRTGDARNLRASLRGHRKGSFDAVITSPPYANALPYIDTDRLSLRAFDMLDGGGQRAAEQRQIGNREVPDRQIRKLNLEVEQEIRDPQLPPALSRLLIKARRAAREPTAGFRRQRTPALLLTYFRDMQAVLHEMAALLRPGAPAVMVIGDSTVAGPSNVTLNVPTGALICELANRAGLRLTSTLEKRLTSYGASSTVHQRNAMSAERVLVFRRVG